MSDPRSVASNCWFSAVIFAIFGFGSFVGLPFGFPVIDSATGNLIALPTTLMWLIRSGAVLFAICALLSMKNPGAGELAQGVIGSIIGVGMIAIGVWDVASPWSSGLHPVLLFLLGIWNAWGVLSLVRRGGASAGST